MISEREFRRGKIEQNTTIQEREDGTFLKTEQTKETYLNDEPDYIKLYTKHWFDINQIPEFVRETFLQLAIRMTYCNATNLGQSQVVYTTGINKIEIMKVLGITNDQVWYRHIKALENCHAIGPVYSDDARTKKIRGCYQINPKYAGRGPWLYSAKGERGGIKKLIGHFDYINGLVETEVEYENETPTSENLIYAIDGSTKEGVELFELHEEEQVAYYEGRKVVGLDDYIPFS